MAVELQLRWGTNGKLWARISDTSDLTKSRWQPVEIIRVFDEPWKSMTVLSGPSLAIYELSSDGPTVIALQGSNVLPSPPPETDT